MHESTLTAVLDVAWLCDLLETMMRRQWRQHSACNTQQNIYAVPRNPRLGLTEGADMIALVVYGSWLTTQPWR